MKRTIMSLLGVMMILSLAACTPTPEKNKTGETKPTMEISNGSKEKLPDATAPEMDVISIYTVKEDGSGLEGTMDSVAAGTLDENLLTDLLIQYGVLEEGTEAVEFNEGEEKAAAAGPGAADGETVKGNAVLNLSKLPENGKNDMIVKAVAKTFMENLNVESITIQLNGSPVSDQLSFTELN